MARRRPAFLVPDRTFCRKVALCRLLASCGKRRVQAGLSRSPHKQLRKGQRPGVHPAAAPGSLHSGEHTVTLPPAAPAGRPEGLAPGHEGHRGL